MILHPICIAATIILATATARADELRLRDGRILIGRVSSDSGTVKIVTADGATTLSRDQVLSIRSDAELEAELRRLRSQAGDAPHAWIEIAGLSWFWQLERSMWRDLGRCLDLCPAGSRGRDRLEALLARLEPQLLPTYRLRKPAPERVRALLLLARPTTTAVRLAAIEAVLVTMQEAEVEAELRQQVEESSLSVRRGVALRAISRRSRPGADEFVWERAIIDPSRGLRSSLADSIADSGRSEQAILFLADALNSGQAAVHYRAATTFAEIGHPAAIPHLLAAGTTLTTSAGSGSSSTRGHLAITRQQAYVSDFDVEVAANTAIAKPIVRTVQSGVVLDVTVHSVITERRRVIDAYRQTLRRLGGSDPGPDPSRWSDWDQRRRAGFDTGHN